MKDVDQTHVYLNDGRKILTKKVIWAAGVTCPIINGIPEESYGRSKRLIVNNQLEVKGMMDVYACLLYTSPSPRDGLLSRMPSSA